MLRALRLPLVCILGSALAPAGGCASQPCVGFVPTALENHAELASTVELPSYVTAERVDILVDWAALSSDLDCLPLDPVRDIDLVALTRFPRLSEGEVASALADNTLLQSDTNGYLSCSPGETTRCWLSEFGFGGAGYDVVDTYAEEAGTWLLTFHDGADVSYPLRYFAFLSPRADSSVTLAAVVPSCPQFTFTAQLDLSDPARISAAGGGVPTTRALPLEEAATCSGEAEPSWPVDWGGLGDRPDELVLARYTMPVPELEAAFSDRDALAAERYSLAVEGTRADLAEAASALGVPFAGFSGEGLWLLELRESGWFVPSYPLSVTVIEPTGEAG